MTKKIKIVLDYGHGGGAKHNRGFIGGNEGDNNFRFGQKLKKELETYQNLEIKETRSKISQDPTLYQRATMFNSINPDLYLSIHSNAGGGTGSEVYDRNNKDERNKDQTLPKNLSKTCSQVLAIKDRGLKFKQFAVLGNGNKAKVKCLLEMFFHDNKSDVNKFKKNEDKLAIELAKDIATYYGLKKIEPKKENKKVTEKIKSLFKVQLGAFRDRKNAEKLQKELKAKGYDTYITGGASVESKDSKDSKRITLGSKVKITGRKYATGEFIPDWVKKNTYTVKQIKGDRYLLKEIESWVYLKDIKEA